MSPKYMTIPLRIRDEDRVLPKAARDLMRRCFKDHELGMEVLRKAGIVTKSGRLAAPYRIQKWERELMADPPSKKAARSHK